MKHLIYGMSIISIAFIFSGCGEVQYKYVYPTYPKIKHIKKIPKTKVIVDSNGQITQSSSKNLFSLIKALRRKEAYYDKTIFKWNKFADRKNREAKEHNKKIDFKDI